MANEIDVDWRKIQFDKHPEQTDTIALHFERLNDIAGLRRWNGGPVIWTFQGADECAFVDVQDSQPHVTGLVMPVRWITPGEPQPDTTPTMETSSDDDDGIDGDQS